MKILLDCVVTAINPSQCSTNIQYLTFVEQTLAARSDVFFCWLIPDWVPDELFQEVYPQHPNVRYVRVPQHRDRTKEYLTLCRELDNAVAFNGPSWDFDVLLTMRSGLVPLLRMLATSPRSNKLGWLKQFWLIEAMVLMDFKKTVLTFDRDTQDLFTLSGYLASDTVWLTSQVDKPDIVQRAKELFPPSQVIKLASKIVPVGYGNYMEPVSKDPSTFPDPENGRPLCIAHAGRMEHANKIEEINDLMVKNFVMLGKNVELLVCTVSATWKVFDTSVVDIKMAKRDEFWDLCRTKMHVIINMSEESGSALSVLEPMMFGVPAIIGPRKKTEMTLGPDYPFIVDNKTQAYAMVRMFYDDYPAMYAKWSSWQQTKFRDILKERMQDSSIYKLMQERLLGVEAVRERFKQEHQSKEDNAFVQDVIKFVGSDDEFVLSEVAEKMVKAGKMRSVLLQKMKEGDRDKRGLIWSTDFNVVRNVLLAFHGWEDASPRLGHFRRKSCS